MSPTFALTLIVALMVAAPLAGVAQLRWASSETAHSSAVGVFLLHLALLIAVIWGLDHKVIGPDSPWMFIAVIEFVIAAGVVVWRLVRPNLRRT